MNCLRAMSGRAQMGKLLRTSASRCADVLANAVPREVMVWRLRGVKWGGTARQPKGACAQYAIWWPGEKMLAICECGVVPGVAIGILRPVKYGIGRNALAIVSGIEESGVWERMGGMKPPMSVSQAMAGRRMVDAQEAALARNEIRWSRQRNTNLRAQYDGNED